MKSSIYRGMVFHKRFKPVEHTFTYELDYIYLNLDEIDEVFASSKLWAANKTNLLSFHREDYLPSERDLKSEVLHQVNSLSGEEFEGEIYLLATLRSLGYCLNPIALFYCMDTSGKLQHVLIEVNNTPWNQRHSYLVSGPDFDETTQKSFHVSPFMPMDTQYSWGLGDPDKDLTVSIKVSQDDSQLFFASMALQRIEISQGNVAQLIYSHVKQTFRMVIGIYLHAFKLWLKKVPFYSHPDKQDI